MGWRGEGGLSGGARTMAGGRGRHGQEPGVAARGHPHRGPQLRQRTRRQPEHVGWPLMAPEPIPDGGGSIKVTPADVAAAAKSFAQAQTDLSNAWYTLQSALDANAGMAGDDEPAHKFDDRYA